MGAETMTTWEDYQRGEELKALGEIAQANLQAILDDHGCDNVGQLAHAAYKYTDCGVSLGVRLDNDNAFYGSDLYALDPRAPIVALMVSSIVEGVDEGTSTVTINLLDEAFETTGFAVRAYDAALEQVEHEAEAIWRDTHGCPTCAKHFGNVASNGFEECEGDDGITPIWVDCPDCDGDGSII
jgi:hypothetical protein